MDVRTYDGVGELAAEWTALADRAGAVPWIRPEWFDAWWRAFGRGRPEILALRRDGRLAGVAAFARLAGGRLSQSNYHTPEWNLLAEDEGAYGELAAAALAVPHATFRFLHAENAEILRGVARRRLVLQRTLERSPYLPLEGGWDTLEIPSEKKRRQARAKLEQLGALEVDVRDGSENLDALLDEGFAIEGSGWKFEQGTAIVSRPETHRFYTEVARWAAARGILRLFYLRLGGRAIAFELTIADGGRLYDLKGGYDVEFRKFGPGVLMLRDMIRWACDAGLSSFEFLGAAEPQKVEWSDLARERVSLQVFARNPIGLAAWGASRYGPTVARRLRSLRR